MVQQLDRHRLVLQVGLAAEVDRRRTQRGRVPGLHGRQQAFAHARVAGQGAVAERDQRQQVARDRLAGGLRALERLHRADDVGIGAHPVHPHAALFDQRQRMAGVGGLRMRLERFLHLQVGDERGGEAVVVVRAAGGGRGAEGGEVVGFGHGAQVNRPSLRPGARPGPALQSGHPCL